MIERQASRSIAIFLILPNTVRRRQCWSRTPEHHTSDTHHFLAFRQGKGLGPDNNPSNPPFAYTHMFPYIPLHAFPSMHSAFKKPLTQRNWLQVVPLRCLGSTRTELCCSHYWQSAGSQCLPRALVGHCRAQLRDPMRRTKSQSKRAMELAGMYRVFISTLRACPSSLIPKLNMQ
jgi:hypothetical protein